MNGNLRSPAAKLERDFSTNPFRGTGD